MIRLKHSIKGVFLAAVLAAAGVLGSSPAAEAGDLPKIHGFLEEAFGARLENPGKTKHSWFNMAEARLQLKTRYYFTGDNILADWRTVLNFKSDFLLDLHYGGKVITDLRELNALFTPADMIDVKAGRQVLTWGTGDYLFLNDLFPKDYRSFFIGRDDEYLKAPSDALRIMAYHDLVNVDFVFIPIFQPNILPEGQRLSYYNPFTQSIEGRDAHIMFVEPSERPENMVYALRLHRNIKSYEAALYYYRGFDPSPNSFRNQSKHELYFQRLDAYGASIRGPFAWGISNAEISFYYSPEDRDGDTRTIRNSMMKYLLGYTKDLGNDLTMGFQYYVEQKLQYDRYKDSLTPRDTIFPEFRHVVTHRITKLLANQTVKADVFTFFSPSDMDAYIRPTLSWDATDAWNLTVGANLLWGEEIFTEFGSMRNNDNVFARLRYTF